MYPKYGGPRRIQPIPDLLRQEWAEVESIDEALTAGKYHWLCSVCARHWRTTLIGRLCGSGCPHCSHASQRSDIPDCIVPLWREPFPLTKHLIFSKIYNWVCVRGHKRRASISSLIRNPAACRFCGQSRASRARSPRAIPDHVRTEWAETKISFDNAPTKKKFQFRHVVSDPRYPGQVPCERVWRTTIDKRLHGFGCFWCAKDNLPGVRVKKLTVKRTSGTYKATPELIAVAINLRSQKLPDHQVAASIGISVGTYKKYAKRGLFRVKKDTKKYGG